MSDTKETPMSRLARLQAQASDEVNRVATEIRRDMIARNPGVDPRLIDQEIEDLIIEVYVQGARLEAFATRH